MLPEEPEWCFFDSLENYKSYIDNELSKQELPVADTSAIEVSYHLAKKIAKRIERQGEMAFADFMQMALYEPGLGYYASGNQKFGAGGDFVTAPEISPLFAQSFANQFAQAFAATAPYILELGAGSGVFAADLLLELEKLEQLPENYLILEVSAELQQRQEQTIYQKAPHLIDRVLWLTGIPEDFSGIVFANEVVDAIPVGLLRQSNDRLQQSFVSVDEDEFYFNWRVSEANLDFELAENQIIEDRNLISPWLAALIDSCEQAVFILVDYGDSEDAIYHSTRAKGTLQQYYRHHKTPNPLALVGMQDITSSVDFTQLAKVADDKACQLIGYSPQATFLIAAGIEQLAQQKMESLASSDTMTPMQIGQELRQLMMPDEMGENCKVLAFAKNVEVELSGFSLDNRLHRL